MAPGWRLRLRGRWVGVLAWGEGWHNNHHAFKYSARHGLEWWQIDLTYALVCALRSVGLVSKVRLPTEEQKSRMRVGAQPASDGAAKAEHAHAA